MPTRLAPATLLLCLALPACADGDDRTGRVPLDPARRAAGLAAGAGGAGTDSRAALPADAATALDAGNAAFREGRYAAALTGYRAAAVRAPDHAAPHYGMYMVARATGDAALADSALAAVRARSGDLGELADSTVAAAHGGDATRRGAPLPPGHPAVAAPALPPGHPPTGTKAPAAGASVTPP